MQIACRLQQQGHRITVYTRAWRGEVPVGFQVQIIPVRAIRNHARDAQFIGKVLPLLERQRFDRVIGFLKMPGLDVYYAADPCFQARIRRERSRFYRLGARYRQFAAGEEAVFRAAGRTRILILTEQEILHYRDCYGTPQERFYLLPPGISRSCMATADTHEIRAGLRRELGSAEDERLLLAIGSGFKTKGLDRTLRALAALPRTLLAGTRLLVIGEGNARPYRWLAWRLGVADRVRFMGGRADIVRFLQGADLLIHPAYTESAGSVLLEALVSGLPVLATANCGYAGHVERAGAGVVVPVPFRQERLNAALAQMLTSPERKAWSRNGIAYGRTQDLYSKAETAARLITDLSAAGHQGSTGFLL